MFKTFIFAIIFGMIGCGGIDYRNPGEYGDTRIDEDPPVIPPTIGTQYYDCGSFITYINNSLGVETVFTQKQDIDSKIKGLQFRVGLMLTGKYVVAEIPRLIVNDQVYYTVKKGNIYWAKISLIKPVEEIMLKTYTVLKTCDSDMFTSTVQFRW